MWNGATPIPHFHNFASPAGLLLIGDGGWFQRFDWIWQFAQAFHVFSVAGEVVIGLESNPKFGAGAEGVAEDNRQCWVSP